jgi:hypothetical protein
MQLELEGLEQLRVGVTTVQVLAGVVQRLS